MSWPEPAREVRFSPDGTSVREGDSWRKVAPEDQTLELFRLLDPRTFKGIEVHAEETLTWPEQFRVSFHLGEVIKGFQEVREKGVQSVYWTKVYSRENPRPVPSEVREWVANLTVQPRQVTFHASDYLGEARLVEMNQEDLTPKNEAFSLRFSYE